MIRRILRNAKAFHGRVASREQIQVEISFPHHEMWLDLFLDWWRYGFAHLKTQARADESLAFTCELGPKPYAITGPDGNDQSDRWAEAQMLRDVARELWAGLADGQVGAAMRSASRSEALQGTQASGASVGGASGPGSAATSAVAPMGVFAASQTFSGV